MKAIEIHSKTDKNGRLKIDYKLNKENCNVRVIILIDEPETKDDEKIWMESISSNPAFDFLKEPSEDIYSVNDGEPFND